jgi:threonine synthase
VEGNYDEVNRRCREVAAATGLEFANITLRPFYAEGAKTETFEIVEQLGWQAPDHIVTAAAGGTLSSRMHKGLGELQLLGLAETDATRIHIAQPSGCNPIASAILAEEAEIHAGAREPSGSGSAPRTAASETEPSLGSGSANAGAPRRWRARRCPSATR